MFMLTDYEIARQAGIRPIKDIATKLGVDDADLMPYGDEVAKVNLNALTRPRNRPGTPRLVLVSATKRWGLNKLLELINQVLIKVCQPA